ncbi:MAG: hypothetical protein NPINA01_08130 [Nitrospinaceae bacterium]|nr:MAG: hypothetical protein NPINA01_08130 [Nitrospinaceae bacterium]
MTFIALEAVTSNPATARQVGSLPDLNRQESVFDSSEPEELVLAVYFGKYILSKGIIGYLHKGGVQLPLEDIVSLLEFAIQVDPETGRASGWFLNEQRRFALDVNKRKAAVEGKVFKLDPGLISTRPDGIYVDTSLLSRWFPVDFQFNVAQLAIGITSREPLPFEQRLDREKTRNQTGFSSEKLQYPRVTTPYKLIDWPALDFSYNFDYRSEGDAAQSIYSGVLGGDLLYMNSELFLSGDERDTLSDARLRLGRKDPDGNLLGPLRAREVSLGDIFSPQIPLISDSTAGAGFEISSFSIDQRSEFDRINLRGELPVGWEVELYRNEVLLASQVTPNAAGRFDFRNVPLLFGNNILRLVFYGPQGQKRETVRRVLVGKEQTRPGEHSFRFGANLQDQDLFQVRENSGNDQTEGEGRWFGEYEHGITNLFSVAGNFASLPLEDINERQNFASLGLRASLFGAFSRLDVTKDDNGGTALQVATLTDISGINLFLQHGQFFDFISEQVESFSDALESRSNMRLDGTIPMGKLPRIPFSITGEMERRESGRTEVDLSNRLSMTLIGISFSHTLNWFLNRGGNIEPFSRGDGSFLVSGRIQRLSLRGTLDYDVRPESEFRRVSVTGDYALSNDFSTRMSINRELNGDKLTTYLAGLNRRFKIFAVGLDATYSDDGEYSLGTSLTFSLGRDPRRDRWIMTSEKMGTTGAASARVFLDRNQNGRFDRPDKPLKGVKFKNGGKDVQTDKRGLAFLPGLSSYRPVPITVDPESLEDPFWSIDQNAREVVPRPGRAALVNFPVVPTGEVDGTVYLVKGDSETQVSSVEMQLLRKDSDKLHRRLKKTIGKYYINSRGRMARKVNLWANRKTFPPIDFRKGTLSPNRFIEQFGLPTEELLQETVGQVVQTIKTEYDGFYLFSKVPPGRYIVRVSPRQIKRLKLAPPPDREVWVKSAGTIESGLNFVLQQIDSPQSEDPLLAENPLEVSRLPGP